MVTFFQFLQFPDNQSIVGPLGVFNPVGYKSLGGIISIFLPIILVIAGILTFIWLIIGGFRLLFSGGDPKSIAGARDNITFALIGFAIVFAAFWLTLIIQQALGLCIFAVNFLGLTICS